MELRSKIESLSAEETVKKMDSNFELAEALMSLGYEERRVREALAQIPSDQKTLEDRLRSALKHLSHRLN